MQNKKSDFWLNDIFFYALNLDLESTSLTQFEEYTRIIIFQTIIMT